MRELVEAIDISHGTVNFNFARTIGYEKAVSKMSAAFAHHKRDYVTISKQCLEMCQRNPDEFLHRFITVDETSITSHPKRRNRQNNWILLSESAPKKIKSEDRKIGRKGDSHSFLRCTRYNSYRLLSVEVNDQ